MDLEKDLNDSVRKIDQILVQFKKHDINKTKILIENYLNSFDLTLLSSLKFEKKLFFLKNFCSKLKIDWKQGSQTKNIRRTHLIKDSVEVIKEINIHKELKIAFEGELSYDAGGLIREWITLLFNELLNEKKEKNENDLNEKENLCLFEKANTKDISYIFHRNIHFDEKTKEILKFIGVILGKALIENLTVNCCFNKLIYKLILDEELKFEDLIFVDSEVKFFRLIILASQFIK